MGRGSVKYSAGTKKARADIQWQIDQNLVAATRKPECAPEFHAIAFGQAIALATLCWEHRQWSDYDEAFRQQQRLYQLVRGDAA